MEAVVEINAYSQYLGVSPNLPPGSSRFDQVAEGFDCPGPGAVLCGHRYLGQ